MKRFGPFAGFLLVLASSWLTLHAQSGAPAARAEGKAQAPAPPADLMTPATFAGLKWRSIGPAVTSGRVIDIAVRPDHPATWFLATVGGVLTGVMVIAIEADRDSPPLSVTAAVIVCAPTESERVVKEAPEPVAPSRLELQAI